MKIVGLPRSITVILAGLPFTVSLRNIFPACLSTATCGFVATSFVTVAISLALNALCTTPPIAPPTAPASIEPPIHKHPQKTLLK